MNKKEIIIYRVITGLFTAFMSISIFAYFFKFEIAAEMFESLGIPTSLIYPLGIAKILGLIAIWTNKSVLLKNLAYIGFALDFGIALTAHTIAKDGGAPGPAIALILLTLSYIYNRKVYGKN